MDNVMHIVGDLRTLAHQVGLTSGAPRALCGARAGAPYGAPTCPKCMKRAGWTTDKRR